jgi:hypothetical protein
MISALHLPLAATQPLFGSIWLALLAVAGGITALLAGVAGLGRWLAATHPEPLLKVVAASVSLTTPAATQPPRITHAAPTVHGEVSAEIVPVIVAAVADLLGPTAHVTSIRFPCPTTIVTPSLEALMQQWSHEGRRQIYSSHKVR